MDPQSGSFTRKIVCFLRTFYRAISEYGTTPATSHYHPSGSSPTMMEHQRSTGPLWPARGSAGPDQRPKAVRCGSGRGGNLVLWLWGSRYQQWTNAPGFRSRDFLYLFLRHSIVYNIFPLILNLHTPGVVFIIRGYTSYWGKKPPPNNQMNTFC